jgi:AcrR family transcriptional regulator
VSNEAEPRARLLAAVIADMQRTGVSDRSLREVAAAIGTSHRMLLYHFGSREGLLIAVVRAVEEAQRAFLAEMYSDPTLSLADIARGMWRRLADSSLWPNERLFFALYAQALQGRPGTVELLDGIVDAWVAPSVASLVRRGMSPDDAEAEARLGVAVARGLLLDLLATGDRAATDAAVERYIAHLETLAQTQTGDMREPSVSDAGTAAEDAR